MVIFLIASGLLLYMIFGIGVNNFYEEIHGNDHDHCPMMINILLWPFLLVAAAFCKVKDL